MKLTKLQDTFNRHREFFLYAIIGLSGVTIDFLVYLVLVKIGIPAVIASIISVSMGIINNFFWNAHYNFKRTDHLWHRFLRFYAIGATGVILSALFIILFHDIFGASALVAKAVSVPFIVVFQYWFNKNSSFAINHRQVPWNTLAIFGISIAVLSLFVFNAPYFNFTDEADNLLGAQFIAQGHGVIYRDYFSHHMPLSYFVMVPFFLIFGTKLIAIKAAFGLAMGLWLLGMSRHLYKNFGLLSFGMFTILVALTQMLSWSHMILAETLIGFAVCHALILFITRNNKRSVLSEIATYALLGAIPVMSSLSYAPLSVLIYALLFLRIWNNRDRANKLTLIVFTLAVLGLPYLIFAIYLYFTHSYSEMHQEALRFNNLYYSQFTTDAAISPLDGVFSVIQGSTQSFVDAVTMSSKSQVQPLAFLFTISLAVSIAVLLKLRYYLTGLVFTIALIFAANRSGFLYILNGDDRVRASICVTLIGLLLVTIAATHLVNVHEKYDYKKLALGILFVTVLLVILSSVSKLATTGRDYIRGNSLVVSVQQPGSPATVINLVNNNNDYYWVGPIDFSSQIFIKSQNASSYRFYAPWHAICNECTQQLISDIATNKPKVIAFDDTVSIWGHTPDKYAQVFIGSFADKYYRLPDPRLKYFYFEKSHKAEIDQKLHEIGYDTGQVQ